MDDLSEYFLKADPHQSFDEWFKEAQKVEQNPEAMSLATIDLQNRRPNLRTVLFKGRKQSNLIFYTNYSSAKGRELEVSDEACLLFYWHTSKRQVKILGRVTRMDRADSQKYFHGRDRESQLASFVSHQSAPIEDKKALVEKVKAAAKTFEGQDIPCPENWGGFLFHPYEFEFFLYGQFRINDRFLYQWKDKDWSITRLQP